MAPRLSPLWRHAPARAWRRGGFGLLLLAALTAATASAASVPMFAQVAGDAALASTLASVPEDARTADAAAVRLVGGRSPRSADQQVYVRRLGSIPGLTDPIVTGRSIGPDVNYAGLFRPLARANGREARTRLVAVEDPAAELVVVSGAPVPGGVWLPEPVARDLKVGAGDRVSLLVQTHDATHPAPPRAKPPVVASVPVAGTYAVAGDGRRPADAPGSSAWSARQGWLPADSDLLTLPAYLVIADTATVDAVAQRIGDEVLWSVESRLAPDVSLDQARETSAGIADLRRQVRAPDGEPQAGPLRLGLVSGIELLVARADALASATAQRGGLLATAGVAAGLLAGLVIAVLMAIDRRRELAHGAATGVGPGRTAGLWGLESLVPAMAAVLLGVLVARATLAWTGPAGAVTDPSVVDGVRRASLVAAAGVLLVAVVGAVAVLVTERSTTSARTSRLPWVAVLAAVAAMAVVATLTTPATTAGPVALAVPALLSAAAGAVLSVLAAWTFRRALGRSSTRLPRSVPAASRWLALRRLARPGGDQRVVVSVAALGLGMVLFALSAVGATRVATADRVAVAAGASVTARIDGSWVLDRNAPRLPTFEEIDAGVRVPKASTPKVPEGMTLVWRSPVSIEGDFGYRDLLVADPVALQQDAAWGQGRVLAEGRTALGTLVDADRVATAIGADTVPVIAVAQPALRTGDLLTISGQSWTTSVRVVASVPSFPTATSKGMLVAAAPSFLPSIARWDPRLAPSDDTSSPRPFFETWLWSPRPAPDVTAFLDSRSAVATELSTAVEAAQEPTLVAAERSLGYQVALAVFLAFTAVVAAAVHARRLVRRSRGGDALLARVGLGRRGTAVARTWEVVVVVLLALLAAIIANVMVAPLGPLLLDLDRGATPSYELHVTPAALLATLLVAAVMVVASLLSGVRPMLSRRGPAPEEVVLRDDG